VKWPVDVKRRSYRSPVREGKAKATRGRILEVAADLFVTNGYGRTSIEAIASSAGFAPETVYMHFGTKAGLLSALLDVALVGDDAPVALLERSWMQAVRRLPDAESRIQMLARNTRRMLDRLGPIHAVMRGATLAEPDIAALAKRHAQRRLAGQATLVAWIAEVGGLRPDLPQVEATERFFALTSPELHHIFTRDLGWTARRYERWLERALLAELTGASN
jgi:AcrR family transcriptional regulator